MNEKLFGKKLSQARKAAKLTGDMLAEKCELSPAYIRQIESGIKVPSLPVFVDLCNEAHASPSFLLSDSLYEVKNSDKDELLDFCTKASPQQLRIARAVLSGVLDALKET